MYEHEQKLAALEAQVADIKAAMRMLKKRKFDETEPWNCFPCVDKLVLGAKCTSCHGDKRESDEQRDEIANPRCYWNGCDLGCCEGCGLHTTSVCQREECGADGCMEMEGCCCDCAACNCDYQQCFCSNPGEKKLLPKGTLEKLTWFQAAVRGASQRV